jgi:hypothetical protein
MKKLIVSLFLLSTISVFAQQDLLLYNMHEIPQSALINPSNRYNGNFYLGLPVISSTYFSMSNSGFAYSDGVVKRNGKLFLDFNNLIEKLEENNYLSFYSRLDLLSFGFNLSSRTQFNVNMAEVGYFKISYPRDFVRFIYEGNAGFEDNTANFEGIGFTLNHYREIGIGASHQLTDKLRLGARVKYLYGLENIYSERTDISVYTDPETYAITTTSKISVKTSGLEDSEADTYISGRGNNGFGLDMGASYQLTDKFILNGSVLDLGFINWKNDTKTYSNDGEYKYSGVGINVFGDPEDDARESGNTSFDRVADSLEESLQITEGEGAYTAPLTSRFYVGGNYLLGEAHFVGGVFQSEVFQGNLKPSFTVSYGRKLTKWITVTTAFSAINRAFNNVGLGVNLNPGPVQLYFMADNLLGAFQPQHTRHLHLRFGLNLIFGSEKSREIFKPIAGTDTESSNEE